MNVLPAVYHPTGHLAQLQPGDVLAGSGKVISLYHGQASIALATGTTDSLLTGSAFNWVAATYLPTNCLPAFEINALVQVTGITLAVSLYVNGVLVPGSTLSVTATTVGGALYTTPNLAIPDGVLTVQAHANGAANLIGTGILYVARLLIR